MEHAIPRHHPAVVDQTDRGQRLELRLPGSEWQCAKSTFAGLSALVSPTAKPGRYTPVAYALENTCVHLGAVTSGEQSITQRSSQVRRR